MQSPVQGGLNPGLASTPAPTIPLPWGYLEPLVPSAIMHRINLTELRIPIGRSDNNYLKFVGAAVSNSHATIEWNGRTDAMSAVTITDHNTLNGTFVDGVKVEGINVHRLFDGCTVFFGCKVPVVTEEPDYRFTFHHAFGRSKDESIFNHYVVGDQIGGGAHGSVFRVLEKKTGKMFALKTSWEHEDTNVEVILCAGQEVMALMSLEHINIARLHEVFFRMDGEMVDMVLEYVDGVTLEEVLRTPLDEIYAKELAYQLCTAVSFMHDRNISHGDLKGNNVLLTREDRPKIKLIDFGLAQITGTFNMKVAVTDCPYTAPEAKALNLKKEATHSQCRQFDDWGLGCLIFNLLSSTHPFPQAGAFNPACDVISWELLSTNSDEAQDLVKKLLVAKPKHRITATAALEHPWFQDYKPYQVSFAAVLDLPSPDIAVTDDDSDSDMEEDVDAVKPVPARRRADKGKTRERRPRARPGYLERLRLQNHKAPRPRPRPRAGSPPEPVRRFAPRRRAETSNMVLEER
ncbi:kinase-like domain-containing protein [Mycena filopes]|nr:kinase-like domain-containing protein [Mycena filopes]